MNTLTWQNCFHALQDQAGKILPLTQDAPAVPAERQQQAIEALKDTVDYERFFFVIDNVSFSAVQVHGTYRWLGWEEQHFTLKKFYSIIHPTFLAAHITCVCELMRSTMQGRWAIQFMSPRLTIIVALRHSGGDYFLFKMYCFPFQHDRQSRVLSYLAEFTLLGPYANESFRARLTDQHGRSMAWDSGLVRRMVHAFRDKSVFSNQEFRILASFADHPELTSAQAAHLFHVKESTIITHKRRILLKAEKYFQKRFATMKEVAAYLRACRLI